MTSLAVEPYIIPSADMGRENPLPVFRNPVQDISIDFEANNVPLEDRPGMGSQNGFRALPYKMQDGYNRQRISRSFSSLVLENEYLKVTVLPEVGGKVASIVYKPLQREILFHNPVFQPANLAIRNAWTAGGIEWNVSHLGHTFLTSSPVHAAKLTGPNGEPVIRLYAWERVKCFPYYIDLHLPDDSRFLYAHINLTNPHDHAMPMYWWTNIGAPEYPGGRVLSPGDTAYKGCTMRDCPVIDGVDQSYATNVNVSYDLFFRIPEGCRRWVALVDKDGRGMVHTSTDMLKSRKQFAWGMSSGGRRWNEYLSMPGLHYLEIQAGLCPTQMHTVPMPAGAQWCWTEAIGYMEMDADTAHSTDWQHAYNEAERILGEMLARESVDEFHANAKETASHAPDEVLSRGSGWGALECRRASLCSQECVITCATPFSYDEISNEQEPWLSLLENGHFPIIDPVCEPGSYMIQDSWRELLERSLERDDADNWLAWYHLGVMKMEAGDDQGAEQAWEKSNKLSQNAWSLRNLAVLAGRRGEAQKAIGLLESAWHAGPKIPALAIELGNSLVGADRWDDLESMLVNLPDDVKEHERIRLLRARAAVRSNRLDLAEQLLDWEFATIKEGEVSLTDIWFEVQARKLAQNAGVEVTDDLIERVRRDRVPPTLIDFRPSDGDEKYIPPQSAAEKK
ncbi:DUF5107 domain-containing protein [bacterium]|nr:DUF5107 domain-containing protein [bacterium]